MPGIHIFNDLFLSMNGHTNHVVDLVIQTYGGLIGKKGIKNSAMNDENEKDGISGVNTVTVEEEIDLDKDDTTISSRRLIIPNAKNAIDTDLIISRSHSFSLRIDESDDDDGDDTGHSFNVSI